MKVNNFFDQADTIWRRPSGALHLYALPEYEVDVFDSYKTIAPILGNFSNLAVQPAEYLHVTLRRFEIYEEEEPPGWEALKNDLALRVAEVPRFTLDFRSPVLAPASVAAQSEGNNGWDAVQSAITDAFLAHPLYDALTPAPAIPHYTLAYSKQKAKKHTVQSALRGLEISTSILIRDVCLVSVEQNRETGIFSFKTLEKWPLK